MERQIYRDQRQRGKIFRPQVSAMTDTMLIQSQETLSGHPCGCKVPKLWAVLECFPGPQAGSWKGSGAAGIELVPIRDPRSARQGS